MILFYETAAAEVVMLGNEDGMLERQPIAPIILLLLGEEYACTDVDQDGYFAEKGCGTLVDCDDSLPDVNPGATEVCDGIDNDCDEKIDEPGVTGCTTYYYDGDGDTYGVDGDTRCRCAPAGYYTALVGGDCDDSHPYVNPGLSEDCSDGIDNNCNGQTDGDDIACSGCIDINEPNNTCESYAPLGIVGEDSLRSWNRTIYPAGDQDHFSFFAKEGTHACFPLTDQDYTIRIRLIPPQGVDCRDYDLYLLNDSCQQLASSTASHCTEDIINYTWDGACGSDDSRHFRVRVRPYPSAGVYNCTEYTLVIQMWQE